MPPKKKVSQGEPTGNTKTVGDNQCYRWQFTQSANNKKGEPIEPKVIYDNLMPFCKELYYQFEIGDGGYRHYQGCFSLKTKERFSTAKNVCGFHDIHIEPAKNWFALKNYCNKNATREDGPWTHETKWITVTLHNKWWQEPVVQRCREEADLRTILWIWSETGGMGKTEFCKWAAINLPDCCVIGGNGGFADIAQAIVGEPKIVIFDFPREVQSRVNYCAIEKVKDGMIFSGKYESRTKIFNNPHVICLANYPPYEESMSKDRWEIIKLD